MTQTQTLERPTQTMPFHPHELSAVRRECGYTDGPFINAQLAPLTETECVQVRRYLATIERCSPEDRREWRVRLCLFLAVPQGPGLED